MRNRIVLFVVGFHCLCLAAALFTANAPRKPKRKPLVVHTIIPVTPPKRQAPVKATPIAATPRPIRAAPPKPQQPPKPAPKKEPAIADKKIATPKQAIKPPPRAAISDALKKELAESLAKLNTPTPQNKKNSPVLRPHTLQIDTATLSTAERNYTEQLVDTLHQALRLPEIGEVKIQLTLHQDGTIAKLVVLNTQSQKNKAYLEAHLPQIRCPRLDGVYAHKKECTFTLTFCNEI